MPESRPSRIARAVVGGLLVAESIALLVTAVFVAIIGGLSGALALGAGAGNAKEVVLAQGIAIVVLTTLSPFLVTAAVGAGGVFLLLRRRRGVIMAAGVLVLAIQIIFHVLLEERFHLVELVFSALHLTVIAVAFACVPPATRTARAR